MISIHNCDCFEHMSKMPNKCVDVVLTSPFYNTNKKAGKSRTLENTSVKNNAYNYVRYDLHVDNMTNEQYALYTGALFTELDRILKPDGCVLYNMSYGSENTEGMWLTIAHILQNTPFTIADCIVWKKKNVFPNSTSKNKLTRITEYVFVFCRKNELATFNCNKRVTSYRKTGQPAYENVFNFIEARNNDAPCPFNKATYSTELCEWLLRLYCPQSPSAVVFDPFIGSGTTAVACQHLGLSCIGCEISENQVKWTNDRLKQDLLTFGKTQSSQLDSPRSRKRRSRAEAGDIEQLDVWSLLKTTDEEVPDCG